MCMLREEKNKYEYIAKYVDDLLIASKNTTDYPVLERKIQDQNQR